MAGAPLSREAVDETLAGLGAANDRIAAAMFAIDGHAGLAFLRGGGLAGQTATRWAALRPELDLLWAQFTLLGQLLDRARAIRGQRRPGDADWDTLRLICGEPVVGLDAAGLPVEPGTGTAVNRIRLWDLATGLERRCATVTGHLSEVDGSWSAAAARYAPLTQEIDALAAQADSVGLAELAAALTAALAEAAQRDLGDPLTAAPGGRAGADLEARLTALVERMATVRERVGALVAVRDGYPRRVAELRALVDQVAAAEARLAEVYGLVERKVADPGLPPLPYSSQVLHNRLAELDRLHGARRWAELVDAAAQLESSATRARDRAGELHSAAQGLLARREELRGRLEAYRAKAAGLGYAEHDQLATAYTAARELLYTAPCDLRAATRAVFVYQQALAALPRPTRHGGDHDDS
jgi:hypothetical protein